MRGASTALVGLVLAIGVLSTACGPVACPQALLSGKLVEIDGALVVEAPDGHQSAVDWSNFSLRREDDDIVVTDVWGTALAREGDLVDLGGGTDPGDSAFKVCGQVEVVGS